MQLQNVVYFLVWAGFFYLMMRFGCGAHVMGHGRSRGDGQTGEHAAMPPQHAVDPVCGRTVDTAAAKSSAYRGRIYYFDSPECRSAFETNPVAYDSAHEQRGYRHGC